MSEIYSFDLICEYDKELQCLGLHRSFSVYSENPVSSYFNSKYSGNVVGSAEG